MTAGPREARCKSCGAAIWWALTQTNARTPVDAEQVPDGNMVLAWNKGLQELRVEAYREPEHLGRNRYRSHFVSCPRASQHRKPRATQEELLAPPKPCSCGVKGKSCPTCGACQATGHQRCGCEKGGQQ